MKKTRKSAIQCDKILTSQLIVFWLDCGSESFRDEYVRRLRICGLSEENALLTFEFAIVILVYTINVLLIVFALEKFGSKVQSFFELQI